MVRGFLQVAERKFSHPLEVNKTDIEKYIYWKIEKHHCSTSYQRLIVASLDKFYLSLFHTQLNIKHLYPHTKNKSLPVYLTAKESVSTMKPIGKQQ
jgi:site-specific recombinase XerD